jgi:hypothetical protein
MSTYTGHSIDISESLLFTGAYGFNPDIQVQRAERRCIPTKPDTNTRGGRAGSVNFWNEA